jgi:phytoene dehydrogenase-like protein
MTAVTQGPRKVAIIGGGIAGLCAAVYAAQSGYQVEVLEQHSVPGGLATSWSRGEYTFETCLHWLVGSNPKGTLHEQWREVFDIDKLTFIQPEEYLRLESERGEKLSIYSDVTRLEPELLKTAPEDRVEIRRFASAIQRLADFPLLEAGDTWSQRVSAFLRMALRLPLLIRLARISGEEYGRRFKHPLLRRFFTEGTSGRISVVAIVFMLAWMSRANAAYPIGGSKAIIRPIVERLTALGGRLRVGAKVEAILVENLAAVGVRLVGGEVIKADWVISAADGHATIYDLLGGKYKDDAIDKLYGKGETFPSYLQVSLGVASDLSSAPGHLMQVLEAPLKIDPETSMDAVTFRIFHFDPTFAPAGKTAVTCFLPTYNFGYWVDLQRSDPVRYENEKRRIADAVVAILERRLPGIRERIEATDISTPVSVVQFTGNWKGSMEGWLPTPRAGFGKRRQTLPGLRRFLMVGQWVQPGGGLPTGLTTARAAIQSVCKQDGLPFSPGRVHSDASVR